MIFAIVDDDLKILDQLEKYIKIFAASIKESIQTKKFKSGDEFLTENSKQYDAAFLDINMPGKSGMEIARMLRKKNNTISIIFVTELANYAIEGYKVEALDYILKPIQYFQIELVLRKLLRNIQNQENRTIVIQYKGMTVVLKTAELCYIEVLDHYVTYVTINKSFRLKETLTQAEEKIKGLSFIRCNRYCVVNVKYITEISADSIVAAGKSFSVSRAKRKEIMKKVMEFHGGLR